MFLHTGLQNYVVLEEIEAVNSNVYSAPTKRAIRAAEQQERLIDHTEGRKTRSVLFMKSGAIVLSTIESMTLVKRANAVLSGAANAEIALDGDDEDADEPEEVVEAPKAKAAPAAAAKGKAAPAAKGKAAPAAKGKGKQAADEDDDDILTDLPE
jgi:regulator of extracellular matrix RemA (YlzA/DUF370 family)